MSPPDKRPDSFCRNNLKLLKNPAWTNCWVSLVSPHLRILWVRTQENIFCRTPTSPCWTEIRSSKTRLAPLPAPSAQKVRRWFLESLIQPTSNESPGQKSAERIRQNRGRGQHFVLVR